ncbi:hypothetical protein AMS68_002341 [Peltaster fructicola]|uniref:Disintegrin and metalloproteinase domain-containing protein B n=1 Tax=Peltaster fructicola TaxID=286661 RepID=A0A6H0XQ11_9PEZI|nr:hypothetical protein AMS68_002341 [Peltaster fructicola]
MPAMPLLRPTLLSLVVSILSTSQLVESSSTIRNPIGAITTVQNATIHTYNHYVTALSDFKLSFTIQNEVNVKFHLEPNHDILAEDAVISYLAPDGSITHEEEVDRLRHKIYKGSAWVQKVGAEEDHWRRVGWARINVIEDGRTPLFEGAFSMDHDSHHIQTPSNYASTRHSDDPVYVPAHDTSRELVLWRDSDIRPDRWQHTELKRSAEPIAECQADQLDFNMQPDHPVYVAMRRRDETMGYMDFNHLFGKRQTDTTTSGNGAGVNLVSTIGQSSGCPNTRKVALVGVATDCTYTGAFSSQQDARENVISQMNQASEVWESAFNISLGLQKLVISDASCPGTPATATQWNQACSSNVDITARLNLFSGWRGSQNDNNSHWTLLSTCNTGAAVGLAWLGQACVQQSFTNNGSSTGNGQSSGSQTVSGANVVVRTGGASEWQIIAHETGHTFGAVHDCVDSTCSDGQTVQSQQCCPLSASTCPAGGKYIMNPSTSSGINTFSPCSIGNICSAIGRNSVKTSCLSNNKQVTTISGQQCGNGIVENGEDCDCGGTTGCGSNKCCNPTTCKFINNAVCDDSNEDCCRGCQYASNSTVCRASTGVCDPQETCTGSSPTCPADKTSPDGDSCGNGLQCASGHCTSRDQQCKSVMGNYNQGNDTTACNSDSCVISCSSPEFGQNLCYSIQQNFLDGTPCSGDGKCQNGQCQGTTPGGQITSWVNDHKAIVIGVCSGVGALLLLAVACCIISCCRKRGRTPKNKAVATPSPPRTGAWQGWNAASQPQMSQPGYSNPQHPSQGWFSNATNNVPPPPAPTYNAPMRYA